MLSRGFKCTGGGSYQTMINHVLREHVNSKKETNQQDHKLSIANIEQIIQKTVQETIKHKSLQAA